MEKHNPKENASFLSLLLFWWMEDIMRKGSKTSLNEADLFPLLDEEKSKGLVEKLEQEWLQEKAMCRRKGTRPRLWRCLLRMISWKECVFMVALRLVCGAAYVLIPVMLWFFLHSLANSSRINYKSALLWVMGICVTTLSLSVIIPYWVFITSVLGIRWKTATIGLIYKKIIKMKRSHLEQVLSGNTINLASNDAQRLEHAAVEIGYLLCCPVDVLVYALLLWQLIGWEALAGSSFMVLVVVYIVVMTIKATKLRKKSAAVTDQRLSVMNEIIPGIRTLKMYAWEEKYRSLVQTLRRKEINFLRLKASISSSFSALCNTVTNIAGFIAVSLMLFSGKEISAILVFTMLSLLDVMRFTFCLCVAQGLLYAADVHVGLRRMETFLEETNIQQNPDITKELREETATRTNANGAGSLPVYYRGRKYRPEVVRRESMRTGKPILLDFTRLPSISYSKRHERHLSLDRVCCSWNEDKQTLSNVSLNFKGDQLVVVTGPVGSGKSSLLMTILGELPISSGQISSASNIAYVSQIPWVFSGTFRDNILFGRPFDERRYNDILCACDLFKDISCFPKGDLTQIGERGVCLSGGQRARVSLARAVYAEADIYLLDDPLSAVDAKVGKHIFERCICGMLSSSLRILATHQLQYLSLADHIVVLRDGKIVQEGNYSQLKDIGLISINTDGKWNSAVEAPVKICEDSLKDLEGEEEDRMTGSVSWRLYWEFFRAGLPLVLTVCLILLVISVPVSILSPYLWLSHMIEMSHDQQRAPRTLLIYGALVAGSFLMSISGAFSVLYAVLRSSEKLYNRMTTAVIRAPVLFFDTNPSGRILNRFSKDIGSMDDLLPLGILHAQHFVLVSVSAILLSAIINVWLLLAVVPVTALAFFVTRYYMRSSRELKRLEAIKCSPVYSHISETVRGLEIIRSSNMETDFLERFYSYQDENTRALYLVCACSSWFSIRLDILCSLFVTAVSVAAVLVSQNPVTAGLSLTYAMQIIISLVYGFKELSKVENLMTSAERVMTYTKLEPEPGYHVKTEPPDSWPQEGSLEVKDVSLCYIDGGARVLQDLSFSIKAKEKVGVAGRTGAGKSSMVAALFRMPEPKGAVFIDGVDTGKLSLQAARRAMAVITQDPVLFGGSLSRNLDPFAQFTDVDLWAALETVRLKPLVEKLPGQLQFRVKESGSNFSAGERQLVCLARALLQKTKIIIMDEATANVDFKTDRLIQEVIRDRFQECTVLTIAHRLNTIIDYDKVLVLDGGRLVEFDKPQVLLAKKNGVFAQLVQTHM